MSTPDATAATATPPADAAPPDTLIAGNESAFDASAFEQSLERREPKRWIGWRLRLLVLAALLGCAAVFAMMRTLAGSAYLDVGLQAAGRGQVTLLAGGAEALRAMSGRIVDSVGPVDARADRPPIRLDELALQRTARWIVDDSRRERYLELHDHLATLFAQGQVRLRFADGTQAIVATPARGYAGLGPVFWPMTAFALLLYLVATAVLLLRPDGRNALYLLIAWSQAANLLLMAAEPSRGIGQPLGFGTLDLTLRQLLDLVAAAAVVCVFAYYPNRVPSARTVALGAVGSAIIWAAALAGDALPRPWWTTQGLLLALGLTGVVVIAWSHRLRPDPFAAVMRRFAFIAVATHALVTMAVAATHGLVGAAPGIAAVGAVVWYLFFASLLLLVPFLSRSRRVLREFSLLAGIGTVATSLTLIFVALFSLGAVAALMLAMGLALAVYGVARQWILNQMVGASVLTTERTFEQLYRVAREVHDHPEQTPQLLSRLLHDLFEPQEMLTVPRRLASARVVGAGSALYVPLPGEGTSSDRNQVLIMRHASRGKRIFTLDDARLADRVVDQLVRAVAYDRAVERGRAEERTRIAQDLHDDIGARLLTLMYKAQDREMEEYVRHTLQDLKTLTRGLAATSHHLAHAAGEWRADLDQRVGAARLRFGWSFHADGDIALTVVQWSGLTRVLRELVSNAIYHAGGSRIDVTLQLEAGTLVLEVSDDGRGGDPASWSHGLGLGGVRKRVRALGGSVTWSPNEGAGIRCRVVVPGLGGPVATGDS